jgi:methyl-accepting chemotaxis protein
MQKSSELISEIAAASKEQSQGIEQVATSVAQMNQVTQANAATAEESSSASESLNAQVNQVNSMIAELSAIVGSRNSADNGRGHVAGRARDVVGGLRHTTADFFHKGAREVQARLAVNPLIQKQGKDHRAVVGKRSLRKDPEEVIPLREDKEKDEEVLKNF